MKTTAERIKEAVEQDAKALDYERRAKEPGATGTAPGMLLSMAKQARRYAARLRAMAAVSS